MTIPEDAIFLLPRLEQLGAELGIAVRYEDLNPDPEAAVSTGGLCRVNGAHLVLVDANLGPAQRCKVLINAFKKLDLSTVYLPPLLRQLLDE